MTGNRDWEESVAVKNSMYRVEAADDPTQVFMCSSNPNKLVCRVCKSFAHSNFCKHVAACNHLEEQAKPLGERNTLVDLHRLTQPLYDKSVTKKSRKEDRQRLAVAGRNVKANRYQRTSTYDGKRKRSSGQAQTEADTPRRAAACKSKAQKVAGAHSACSGRAQRTPASAATLAPVGGGSTKAAGQGEPDYLQRMVDDAAARKTREKQTVAECEERAERLMPGQLPPGFVAFCRGAAAAAPAAPAAPAPAPDDPTANSPGDAPAGTQQSESKAAASSKSKLQEVRASKSKLRGGSVLAKERGERRRVLETPRLSGPQTRRGAQRAAAEPPPCLPATEGARRLSATEAGRGKKCRSNTDGDGPCGRFPCGAHVRVRFDRRYLHAGTVTAWHASGLCSVRFDDGDVLHDVEPSELLADRDSFGLSTAPNVSTPVLQTEPPTAIEPCTSQLELASLQLNVGDCCRRIRMLAARLPLRSIVPDMCPGGGLHCGGDLCFPNLTLAHPGCGHKMPVFVMLPGAVAAFDAVTLCHGTTQFRDSICDGADGCGASISFACQTTAAVLGLNTRKEREAAHQEMLAVGQKDARVSWSGADVVWLPVFQFSEVKAPHGHLQFDVEQMHALPYRRIALYDAASGQVLVFFDADGGLAKDIPGAPAAFARRHFQFLRREWDFTLHRQKAETSRNGCLHLDRQGKQRMVMLGLRSSKRNMHHRPERKRPGAAA